MNNKSVNKETSLRNQHKVLRYILENPKREHGFDLFVPIDFEKKFTSVFSVDNFKNILLILQGKGLIKVEFNSNAKYDTFIYSIVILPKGYDYFHQLRKERLAFWLPLISSSALSVIAIIVSVIAICFRLN